MQVKHTKTNNIANWTQAQLNTIIAGGAAQHQDSGGGASTYTGFFIQ